MKIMPEDFTLRKYRELCSALMDLGYVPIRVADYFERKFDQRLVIMRHDVDRMSFRALRMARAEKEMDVISTFYFRHRRSVFNVGLLQELNKMGFEIGYHYETLDKAKGNYGLAIRIFEKELSEFNKICPVRTICAHGNPLTKWDNKNLWRTYDFRSYGILGEASLSLDYGKVAYYSDTGRTWNVFRDKVKDFVPQHDVENLSDTDSLIRALKKKNIDICLTTHPERWNDELHAYIISAGFDFCANKLKYLIRLLRRTPNAMQDMRLG